MKKRSLIILLAVPTLLSGCSAFKKFIHPIDWFKTKILKIEDVTIDAQDLAELPDKMKSFTADISFETHRVDYQPSLYGDTLNEYAIFKFKFDDNGDAHYSYQPYTVETHECTKLDLLQEFAMSYPGVTPTDELLNTYINLKYPSAKIEDDGLNYKISYKVLKSIYTNDLFYGLSVDVDEKTIFAALKGLSSTAYYGLKFNSKGKYYEPNNATEFFASIFAQIVNASIDYRLYFKDNLLTKVEGSFTEDNYRTEFVINIYDIGNTTPDERYTYSEGYDIIKK